MLSEKTIFLFFSARVACAALWSGQRKCLIPGRMCTFCMCALFQSYPPTINFLEWWMHLSDGGAKVVTLSHHAMRASNDCLGEIAISSNVFENISHPRSLCPSLASLPTPEEFPFDLCYQFFGFGAAHGGVKWHFGPAGCPSRKFHYLSWRFYPEIYSF